MTKRKTRTGRNIWDGLTLDEVDKIFAAAGNKLSPELRAEIEWLDRQGWSLEKQRKWLAAKYGKPQ